MSEKHTALPWIADRETILSEGVIVASCCFGVRTRSECEANADFIARCCNCHDELVAACKTIAALADGQGMRNLIEVAGQARAALAHAEAED